MEPVFKAYRKITPTIARVLTELDYDARGGIIQTNEGPSSFLPGDSLARDSKGEWPIPVSMIRHVDRELFEASYELAEEENNATSGK